ncbi:DNA binding methylated-DNA--cysteine S-methyltransferase [Marasmius fiardii PR-910]|nr:DNA binding methylated-DNA--cysteine S-methyltransferase [Marasmius fiardii PR-910]
MPALRNSKLVVTQITMSTLPPELVSHVKGRASLLPSTIIDSKAINDHQEALSVSSPDNTKIYYPATELERKAFQTKDGKVISAHHWDVYDFIRTIPCGKVTTYKEVSRAVGGSPRSVGNALRNNPFAPYIPCHRVIASNLFAGGFCGEWGANSKTGTQYFRKLDFLKKEGLSFSDKGILQDPDKTLWIP